MIRRWSYLTKPSSSLQFRGKTHRYAFKMFRLLTRFKRFTFGVTKFNRRSWFRLKSRQSWFKLHASIATGLELRKQIQSLYRYQFYAQIMPSADDIFVRNWYHMAKNVRFSILPMSFISLRIRKTIGVVTSSGYSPKRNDHQSWGLPYLKLNPLSTIRVISLKNAKILDRSSWISELIILEQICELHQLMFLRENYNRAGRQIVSLLPFLSK